ncbi:MAG: hypothetical protein IKZ62_05125 [Prevotella sp.]|nr:hypothetical protein [Prevotella sp.]
MKKYLLSFAVIMSTVLFTACNKDDNDPQKYEIPVSNGVYVVGSGNTGNSIVGNLTYFDYETMTGTLNAFSKANGGMSLGMTANDALRYGGKLYIVVDGEHSVFVCNAQSMRVITKIDMTAATMLGETGGVSPRRIAADDGKIYVSTYGNMVAAIDTTNFALVKKYEVGSKPEGVCVTNGYLYTANSDYGYGNASISVIRLSTGEVSTLTNESIRNPQDIAVDDAGTIYFLDYGQYDSEPPYTQRNAGVYKISGNIVTKVVANATGMTCAGSKIYTYNAPYSYGEVIPVSYSIYDIQTGTSSSFSPSDIESPAAIGIDPLTGYLYIASYHMVESEWGTYADYSSNGYVNYYDGAYNKKGSFECGVGPQRIVFNISTEIVEL